MTTSKELNYGEQVEANELRAYGDNNYDLYRSRGVPMQKNLDRKINKGVFDFDKSVKLWRYWTDDANKRYKADQGVSFSTKVRQHVAFNKALDYVLDLDDTPIETKCALLRTKEFAQFMGRVWI